ncbi:alkaline phosphatase D family protein [Nocardioides lianchengensis]|uniref:Alkaline phosphatase D n=1 Tax=Nocardioides lianchengensis TaxID=1045774 RepID=A0A1G6ZF49_9ACTN|nr:alkaline phosphatase D family protein [Nocardioides lianchengensis]NYG11415.1 alkaline phosphatase D [Nocardioides lianchengensis]SDE00877.1 alkaline phosphatase D [Nocardioides lianchengensis]
MTDLGQHLLRRTLLAGSAAGLLAAAPASASAGLVRRRLTLPSGVQSGDVTTRSAVLWARSSGRGRLVAEVVSGRRRHRLRGPWATATSDHTAKLALDRLAPGREYDVRLGFEDEHGLLGETRTARFRTASLHEAATSFVWTGDTCGQGWGINPDLGGLVGYRAMHETRPDLFVHAGDTIYADGPIAATVTEPDGQVWRNLVTEEVSKVAETLGEFRGRHRYTLLDENVRAFYADTPVVAQWDDHETTNNWYPGEVLEDPRYTQERRVDVLAQRARRAWQEYQPIADPAAHRRDGGFAPARIYRKVERGRHLDVFCLDMRTHKDPNTAGLEPDGTRILGPEQADWLVREVRRSRATWKVISADLPLGVVVPDGEAQESLANGDPGAPLGKEQEIAAVLAAFKRHRVRNVVWITADVHYCAAHHYSPERAGFTDFDPFWEFVAGPIAAGTFGPNELDGTFGPEVVFRKHAATPNESPRHGNQFFGHADIAADGRLTVSLRDLTGAVLFSQDLEPEGR